MKNPYLELEKIKNRATEIIKQNHKHQAEVKEYEEKLRHYKKELAEYKKWPLNIRINDDRPEKPSDPDEKFFQMPNTKFILTFITHFILR